MIVHLPDSDTGIAALAYSLSIYRPIGFFSSISTILHTVLPSPTIHLFSPFAFFLYCVSRHVGSQFVPSIFL